MLPTLTPSWPSAVSTVEYRLSVSRWVVAMGNTLDRGEPLPSASSFYRDTFDSYSIGFWCNL